MCLKTGAFFGAETLMGSFWGLNFTVAFPSRSHDALIDGFCGWWDADFGLGTMPLSTAPDAPATVALGGKVIVNMCKVGPGSISSW